MAQLDKSSCINLFTWIFISDSSDNHDNWGDNLPPIIGVKQVFRNILIIYKNIWMSFLSLGLTNQKGKEISLVILVRIAEERNRPKMEPNLKSHKFSLWVEKKKLDLPFCNRNDCHSKYFPFLPLPSPL